MFAFAYRVKEDTLTLDFFDVIARYGISASGVGRVLEENPGASQLRIRLYSPGGSVYEGLAIRSLLREDKRPITVKVIGLAASMATVLASSIRARVVMDPSAEWMIHNPWTIAIGDSREMRKAADQLDKLEARTAALYKQKSNLPIEKIRELMAASTWMSAEEAMKAGFVDALDDDENDREDQEKTEGSVQASTVNSWQQVIAQFKRPNPKCLERWTSQMKFSAEFLAKFNLPADATAEQIEKAMMAAAPITDRSRFVPVEDYQAALAAKQEAEAQAKEAAAKQEAEREAEFSARMDTAIGTAIAQGRISPATKQYHRDTILARGSDREKGLQAFIAMVQITADWRSKKWKRL